MIFVTLGSQKFQFNRLLKEIDRLCEKNVFDDEVFAQTGFSDYKPLHYPYRQFLDRDEFKEHMKEADIIITHGGTGAITEALKNGKKVIAVPRMEKYGEHIDDHQKQIIEHFADLGLISACFEIEKLEDVYKQVGPGKFHSFTSNTQAIIDSIAAFIDQDQ